MSVSLRSGKGGWVGSGAPNATHFDGARLKCSTTHDIFARHPLPAERGETVTQADWSLTVAEGAVGAVTFTVRRVSEKVPWSNLTWEEKPGVTGASVTVAVTDPAAGDVITFDIAALAQAGVDGRHYGWRITSNSADPVRFYGFDHEDGPVLVFNATEAPAAATDLIPNGIGSSAKPFLQWSAPDLTGERDQAAFQVQIAGTAAPAEDADGTWTAPTYDSGTVADPMPELDLISTAYAGLADAGEFYWQVRWYSEAGVWAPWSETAHYTRDVKDAITVTNPTLGEVNDDQPVFAASMLGTTAWRMILRNADNTSREYADSGWTKASADAFTWQAQDTHETWWGIQIPAGPLTLKNSINYELVVRARTAVKRVRTVGDPAYSEIVVPFIVNEATAVEAPFLVSVGAHALMPLIQLEFTRSTMPDRFTIERDGEAVDTVDAVDIWVSGTTYRWTDPAATPMRDHSYRVRARVDGSGPSAWSAAVVGDVTPMGVWFISSDQTKWIVLGNPQFTPTRTDDAAVFRTRGRNGKVGVTVVKYALGPFEGSWTGFLEDTSARSAEDSLADLEEMRSEPWVSCIAGNLAMRVSLLDVGPTPHEMMREDREWCDVALRLVQVD